MLLLSLSQERYKELLTQRYFSSTSLTCYLVTLYLISDP